MLEKLARDLPAGTTIHWHNMREEPLIYISGRPFVVREGKNPFMNLEYTGALPSSPLSVPRAKGSGGHARSLKRRVLLTLQAR